MIVELDGKLRKHNGEDNKYTWIELVAAKKTENELQNPNLCPKSNVLISVTKIKEKSAWETDKYQTKVWQTLTDSEFGSLCS